MTVFIISVLSEIGIFGILKNVQKSFKFEIIIIIIFASDREMRFGDFLGGRGWQRNRINIPSSHYSTVHMMPFD